MFHRALKHSKTIKALGLRPRAFISFLVFETPMKHSHSFLKYYLKWMCIVLPCKMSNAAIFFYLGGIFREIRHDQSTKVGRLHSCSVRPFKTLSGNINNHDIGRGKRLVFFEISPHHDFGPSIGRQGKEERYFVHIPEPLIFVRSSFVPLSFD